MFGLFNWGKKKEEKKPIAWSEPYKPPKVVFERFRVVGSGMKLVETPMGYGSVPSRGATAYRMNSWSELDGILTRLKDGFVEDKFSVTVYGVNGKDLTELQNLTPKNGQWLSSWASSWRP